MTRGNGSRSGHRRYRDQRARMLRAAERAGLPCCYCGGAIDYALRYPDKRSPTADHATPVSLGGGNYGVGVELRPAHLYCNMAAGNRGGSVGEPVSDDALDGVVFYDSPTLRHFRDLADAAVEG